jgi:nicotinamidase-related amidase
VARDECRLSPADGLRALDTGILARKSARCTHPTITITPATATRHLPSGVQTMLLSAADSTLLIVDMQGRLMPVIHEGQAVLDAAHKLAQAARLLDVPVAATEHHAKMLGATVEPLRAQVQTTFQKMHFSSALEPGFEAWLPAGRKTVLVAGCEAHICVLQTVIGLLDLGYHAALVSDAAGSRKPSDHHAALRRARAHGAEIVTSEMAIFEWMRTCEHPRFREVLRLVK